MITKDHPDYPAALVAWKSGEVYFPAPPVCTAYWTDESWIRFVDWTYAPNALALREAKDKIARGAA